jgi:hypothetical protein
MTTNYRASSAVTITLASLATSAGLTVGRCSASVANGTNKDDFVIPTLRFRTGGTAPTAGTVLELWCFAQRADSTWPELFTAAYTGSDAGFTISSRDVLFSGAVLCGSYIFDAATGRDVVIRGRELAQVFGAVPQNFAFFVVQSSGQNLDSTGGNFALTVNPGSYT